MRRRRLPLLAFAASFALFTSSQRARAAELDLGFANCNTKPSKSDTAEAKRSYERGKKHLNEGDRAAVDLFRSAYLADCTKHELLIVLSFAYQADGQLAEAVAADELYLQRRGNSLSEEDRQEIEARLRNLRAKLAEQQQLANVSVAPVVREPEPAARAPLPVAEKRQEPAQRGHSPLPWVVVGLGSAALVTGAVLYPVGVAKFPSACESQGLFNRGSCAPVGDALPGNATAEERRQFEEANRPRRQEAGNAKGLQRAGFVTMLAGGAAVAAGLIWFAIDMTSAGSPKSARSSPTRAARVRILPTVSPTSVGLAGTF